MQVSLVPNKITVSKKAAKKIQELTSISKYKCDYIRLGIVGGGCNGFSYKMEFIKDLESGDIEFDSNGVVVVVDHKSMLYLKGTEIDFQEKDFASGFVFNNPNEAARCGCGESFTI
jgi:iron-sulfur cluster assembly protein